MNKLRKAKPSNEEPLAVQRYEHWRRSAVVTAAEGISASEQYWAARAWRSETLLSTKAEHYRQMNLLSFREKAERLRELTAIGQASEERLMKLEKFIIILLSIIVLLVVAVVMLAFGQPRTFFAPPAPTPGRSHFTIPILSPFSSVVENELSVVGPRTIIGIACILTMAGYLLIRQKVALGRFGKES